ncbi:glycosyltransferase family 2 protein [Chloroflexota bacterium]
MNHPMISIVVPSYNSERYIRESIDSILGQEYDNVECIVMDGGSTDGTINILKQYGEKICWLSEKDKGQSDAMNKGLEQAKGEIVACLCSDDIYEPGCFNKIATFFNDNTSVKWVYGKCSIIDEDNIIIRKPITFYKNMLAGKYKYTTLLVSNYITQAATFWRKSLIDEMGVFDLGLHLSMDYEYTLRIGAKYQPGYIDDYLARFRWHSAAKTASGFYKSSAEALKIARKYTLIYKKNYLIPLQYLNYFTIIFIYSLLKLLGK